jgi:putative transposase
MIDYTFHRRHLPHYQPEGAMYHVVFRLKGSLPAAIIEELRAEREKLGTEVAKTKNEEEKKRVQHELHWKHFERFDSLLDGSSSGPSWLKQPDIAATVQKSLHHLDGKEYDLFAYCIMLNHVHVVCVGQVSRPDLDGTGVPSYIVSDIFGSIKKYTARRANKILGRRGPFWQDESYDHVIRDGEELERTIWYVLFNPVKAKLVQSWEQWPWTYIKPGLV